MRRSNIKAFTILELLVVVAIIAIIAIIALPNFVGRIEESKASRELAEINAVEKAIATYYAENGVYPTLQGKDGTLLQPQPIEGAPHNIDFSTLMPDYLASLPHFSYWWVDYTGSVYHTEKAIGSVSAGVFTPVTGYTYTLYKTNGTTQVLSAPYALQAGEYIVGVEEDGTILPKIGQAFKNEKMHPEDPAYVVSIPVTGVSLNKTTLGMLTGVTETLLATVTPSNSTNKTVNWSSSNTSVATVSSSGVVTTVSAGTATITVTTVDGVKTATCVVTVSAPFTSQTFNYTGAIVNFTVPVTGTYKVETWGAQGGTGSGTGNTAGKGAYAKSVVQLTANSTLKVLVGGKGLNRDTSTGSGGGGSFVATSSNTPISVAGGGGGAHGNSYSGNYLHGQSSQTVSNLGGLLPSTSAGQGGTAGYNGWGSPSTAGGGGGFYGDGMANTVSGMGSAGRAFVNGGTVGYGYSGGVHGGYGGGGGTAYVGGGGGGYTGGAAGTGHNGNYHAGGGGGSYFTGTGGVAYGGGDTMPTASGGTQTGQTGNGVIVITYVGP